MAWMRFVNSMIFASLLFTELRESILFLYGTVLKFKNLFSKAIHDIRSPKKHFLLYLLIIMRVWIHRTILQRPHKVSELACAISICDMEMVLTLRSGLPDLDSVYSTFSTFTFETFSTLVSKTLNRWVIPIIVLSRCHLNFDSVNRWVDGSYGQKIQSISYSAATSRRDSQRSIYEAISECWVCA